MAVLTASKSFQLIQETCVIENHTGAFFVANNEEQGFIFVHEGSPEIVIDGKSCKARAGDLFYIPLNKPYSSDGNGVCILFLGKFKGQFAEDDEE